MDFTSHSYNETFELGKKIAEHLKAGDFIALYGDLGAGKTCFVSGLAAGLQSTDPVSSPTFAIVHLYRGKINLAHFDMYRINEDMLEDTGFYEYTEDGSIVACEWCENIPSAVPEDAIEVTLTYGESEDERHISIKGVEF